MDSVEFRRFVDSLNDLAATRINGDIAGTVGKLAATYNLSKMEHDGVLGHLIQGGDLSRYGLINAVTRSAEDNPSYDRATELEALGGRLITADWSVLEVA